MKNNDLIKYYESQTYRLGQSEDLEKAEENYYKLTHPNTVLYSWWGCPPTIGDSPENEALCEKEGNHTNITHFPCKECWEEFLNRD